MVSTDFVLMKLLRFLLFPFAILYDLITSIRNFLFDVNILKSTKFNIPVIVVGNLSVGGTGKTPQIEYLIKLLQKDNKVAVLSRGYKRKTKGYIVLNDSHSSEEVGDEPLQFYKKFSTVRVAVDANRANGIQQLLKANEATDVILLDDAYQHRKVKAGFYVLLTKYNDLYSDDFLLPTGNLRESRSGAKRANVIIVTKCPINLSLQEKNKIQNRLKVESNQQVFFSTISYSDVIKGKEELAISTLSTYEVVLVTGIANPKPMLQFLNSLEVKYHHINFPDHHHFIEKDIEKIISKFNNITAPKLILTTEKDYMRLSSKIDDLYFLPIETQFLDKAEKFNKKIEKFVKR